MAKRLVLHTGLHKTGSTYVQHSLFLNREALAHCGVDVPDTLKHQLGTLRAFAFSFHEPEFQAAFRRLVLESPGDTVLVSSEELSHAIRDHHQAREFLRALSDRDGVEVRIVAYLRRQDEMRESTYQQQVRTHFCGPISAFDGYPFDYSPTVAAFREAGDRVALRPYEPRAWRDGDVLSDLLHSAGLDVTPRLERPGRVNVSLDRRLVLFLSGVPARLKSQWDGVRVLDYYDIVRPDGGRFLSSPEDRRVFLEGYLDANARIAGDDEALCAHLLSAPEDPGWTPPAPVSLVERAGGHAVLAAGRLVHAVRRSAIPTDGVEEQVRRYFSRRIADKEGRRS